MHQCQAFSKRHSRLNHSSSTNLFATSLQNSEYITNELLIFLKLRQMQNMQDLNHSPLIPSLQKTSYREWIITRESTPEHSYLPLKQLLPARECRAPRAPIQNLHAHSSYTAFLSTLSYPFYLRS